MTSIDDGRICLGRLGAPYGIKGWVKLISFTQPRENLLQYRHFGVRVQGADKVLELDAGKPHGKGIIGHFVGYDTPEQVRELTNLELFVDTDLLPELEPGDYYWHQLRGLQVWNAGGILFGCVSDLMETGANDVIIVDPVPGSTDQRQRLIPWLPDHVVLSVDIQAGKILVDWEADYLA
jgi:16S rRNA processing protein RimM